MRKFRIIVLLSLLFLGTFAGMITIPAIADGNVPWEGKGREWYYDNLTDEDRQKIRQAVDYCIPRESIIEGLHHGYAVAIASPIGVNMEGIYEPTIAAREYSPTKALELLKEVFGWTYDENAEGTNDTSKVTDVPYFKMTLVAPTTNTARSQWASLISYSLNKVGIDTILKWWNWNIIMPRLFLDPVGTGYDYEHGGYDMFFVGYDATPDPVYKEYYDKNTFPPSSNCYWIEDGAPTSGKWADKAYPNVTALWTDIYKEPDPNERVKLLKEYQQWCYDWVPSCIIRQEIQLWALDPNLEGFDLFHGIEQNICNWTLTDGSGNPVTSVVIAQPGDYVDFNPLQSNSYYDALIFDNTHCELARRRGDYNIIEPVPWIAESWTHSDDYLTWNVKLREGIKWSDGTELTADDVVFTYQSVLTADAGCPDRGTIQNILGNDTDANGDYTAVTKVNDYEVKFVLPEQYAYVTTVLFNEEILQKAQMSAIPYAQWKTDDTNTGKTGMIGCGPYMFEDYDGATTVTIVENPYYDGVLMGDDPTMTGGGNFLKRQTIETATFKVVKEATSAVAGLKAGTYDVIDSQMGIQAQADDINGSTWGRILTGYEWGYQEMGINHMNPIFGMNAKDPREMYPEDYASAPFDLTGLFLALVLLTCIQIVRKKKK
ncbi:MAG: ABC transporter substrate-binding protein [Candidatus Thorarchaeota archaeon]